MNIQFGGMKIIEFGIIWLFHNALCMVALIGNKFIRMIFNLPRFESTQSVMAKNSLLSIDKLYRYEIALFMFKFHMKQLPSAFSDIFLMKKYPIGFRNNSSSTYGMQNIVKPSVHTI